MRLLRFWIWLGIICLGCLTAHSVMPAMANPPTEAVYFPLVPMQQPRIRLAALYYDTETANEPDEAFRVWNLGTLPFDLAGYAVGDGQRTVTFPTLVLPAGAGLWCAGDALAFTRAFGYAPGCEYATDSDPTVPNLSGAALRFANTGGQALLFNRQRERVDALVYEAGDAAQSGWQGPAVWPWTPNNSFAAEGQLLYRKFDRASGQLRPDSDRAADWAQDPADLYTGQRVQYPGWDLEQLARPAAITASGVLTVALAPDNLWDAVSATISRAQQRIDLASYTLEHTGMADLLAQRAAGGITVRVLLEGGPVGGISDQQRYVTQRIEAAGGQVWYMTSDRNAADDRYSYHHAKYILVDDRLLVVSSENFSPDSMPNDDKNDGTLGRRGSALITDDPTLLAQARALFNTDLDPAHHFDLFRFSAADPKYGAPPAGFEPITSSGGSGYALIHAYPLRVTGDFAAELLHAPETSLLPPEEGGLLGMVAQAGAGDSVLVEQLYERMAWGGANDTPLTAPNPRLQAYIEAARRGATVRILLDSFFDVVPNRQTVDYLTLLAQAEGLDLAARLANPAGLGLHNKMVLVQAGGKGWLHVGSLNGSEASAKINRELALQVQSNAAYTYLAEAFWHDWDTAQ